MPSPNQNLPPCQPWAVHNGWSSDASTGPLCSPLPHLQQLSLDSPPNQNLSYNQLQEPARNSTHNNMQYVCNAEQSVQQSVPDAHVLSTAPPTVPGRNIPPRSPYRHEGMQPFKLQQIPHYSPPNLYQAIDPPFCSQHAHRRLLNQPQSPAQSLLPVSPSRGEPYLNTNHYPDGGNSVSVVGCNETLGSPSAGPIQQEPLWSFAALSKGKHHRIIGKIDLLKLSPISSLTEVLISVFFREH